MITQKREYPFLIVVFFLSGVSSLIYELLWIRQFVIIFGSSTYAIGAVLSSFMCGLSLGSWFFGRIADTTKHLIKLFVALEAMIGIFSFGLLIFFKNFPITFTYVSHFLFFDYGWLFFMMRFFLSFSLLLVPTFLMGGTLPVILKLTLKNADKLGRNIATLYSVNTGGGAIGVVLTGFFLIRNIGLWKTYYLAIFLNLVIAVGVWIYYHNK